MQSLGTSLVTTAPAATTTLLPIVTPGRIVQSAPIQTSSPIVTGETMESFFRRSAGSSERILELPDRLTGVAVTPVRADLTDRSQIDEFWQEFERTGHDLDVAALNAGKSLGGAFIDTDIEDELSMLNLNVTGQVILAKHITRHMAARRSGRILITSSLSATTPTPYESIYGTDPGIHV